MMMVHKIDGHPRAKTKMDTVGEIVWKGRAEIWCGVRMEAEGKLLGSSANVSRLRT